MDQVYAMRQSGMSETAIRRALGLAPRAAAQAGIGDPAGLGGAQDAAARARAGAQDFRPAELRMMDVLLAVSHVAGVEAQTVLGPARDRRHARARQLTIYLLRELCAGTSLPTIGFFLNRDHTTVLYGLRKAAHLMRHDEVFHALAMRARTMLLRRETH